MQRLLDGIARFRTKVFPHRRHLFQRLANKQQPRAMFITCADSRVVPELITQTEPGDLFICRNVGNIVPPYGQVHGGVSAAIEYAVVALGVRNIIVCGHSDCGAMKGMLHADTIDNMPTVRAWLRHAEVARQVVVENYPDLDGKPALQALTKENILAQLNHLRTHPSVAARLASGQLQLHGWVYRIETSEIAAFDAERGRFEPLDGTRLPAGGPRRRLRLADAGAS
jgi:carbonic anhydrase